MMLFYGDKEKCVYVKSKIEKVRVVPNAGKCLEYLKKEDITGILFMPDDLNLVDWIIDLDIRIRNIICYGDEGESTSAALRNAQYKASYVPYDLLKSRLKDFKL